MDGDNRLGEFLRARRELVRPQDVGLPDLGRRRVQGLRREELALLAGVSADYYIRLEQGRDRHPSEAILEALAKVLRLDEMALRHLHTLARPAPRPRRSKPKPERVSPGLVRLLECWSTTPAFVIGRCLDVLAINPLGSALHGGLGPGANLVRLVFLDSTAGCIYGDWEKVADDTVGSLRATAGADPDLPRLAELVGELTLKSEEFRRRWARHDVREKTSGSKRFVHPLVGPLTLSYETLTVNGAAGQMLVAYHAEPDSEHARALARLVASVTAPELAPAPAANSR